jgi:low temperature requirement protein LtrA
MVEAGQSGAALHVDTTGGWTALVAAMVLAGALWWLYFDSVADVNLRVLELSGGSPTMARAIFAVGHMLPAFALLVTASGVGLLLEDDPPRIAYGLACTGVAIYMLGTRVIRMGSGRVPAPVRVLLVVATFAFARLFHGLDAHTYLWLLTGWVITVAALTTRTDATDDEALARFLPPERPERQRRAEAQ